MRINMAAINAHRNLGLAGAGITRSMQRLSGGLRINSAADDPAGLAISEKMRAQIRGMRQAERNAQDGISLLRTADGALFDIHNMIQRIRELVVYAANDTHYFKPTHDILTDRALIQNEIDQLLAEIDLLANRTEFNRKTLLDGRFARPARPSPPPLPSPTSAPIGAAMPFSGAELPPGWPFPNRGTEHWPWSFGAIRSPFRFRDDVVERFNDNPFPGFSAHEQAIFGMSAAIHAHLGYTAWHGLSQDNKDAFLATDAAYGFTPVPQGHEDFNTNFGGARHNLLISAWINQEWPVIDGNQYSERRTLQSLMETELESVTDTESREGIRAIQDFFNDALDSFFQIRVNGLHPWIETDDDNAVFDLESIIGGNFHFSDDSLTLENRNPVFNGGDNGGNNGDNNGGTPGPGPIPPPPPNRPWRPPMPPDNGRGLWFQTGANAGQGFHVFIEGITVNHLDRAGGGDARPGFSFNDLRSHTADRTREQLIAAGFTVGILMEDGERIGEFLPAIDGALRHVSMVRSQVGAYINRLDFSAANLNFSAETLTDAESRIRNTDMALEKIQFVFYNIRQQASIMILAQANRNSEISLQLLEGLGEDD